MDTVSMEVLLDNIRKIVREEINKQNGVDLRPPEGLSNKPLYTIKRNMRTIQNHKTHDL